MDWLPERMDWLPESVATSSSPCARQWTRLSAPDAQAVAPIIATDEAIGAGYVNGQPVVDVAVCAGCLRGRPHEGRGRRRRMRWRLVLLALGREAAVLTAGATRARRTTRGRACAERSVGMAVGVAAGGGRVLNPQEWKEISFS